MAQFPSQSSASDIWSLTDVSRAVQGQNWPIVAQTAYESIATYTVGVGGQTDLTFSSIPDTYKHLQVRWITRSSGGAYNPLIKFNGDSGNNYSWHYLDGNGTSVNVGGATTTNSILIAGVQNTANIFSTAIMDILDYKETTKYKTIKILQGADYNGSGSVDLWSGNWRSNSVVSSITFVTYNAEYSQFALYGIKG